MVQGQNRRGDINLERGKSQLYDKEGDGEQKLRGLALVAETAGHYYTEIHSISPPEKGILRNNSFT